MKSEELIKIRQELVGQIDILFNRVVTGTSIEPKQHEMFYQTVSKIEGTIARLAETISLEKCKLLNDATRKAFEAMEHYIEGRFKQLEEKVDAGQVQNRTTEISSPRTDPAHKSSV